MKEKKRKEEPRLNIWAFIKSEAVLSVACILAVLSMFIVLPDREYAGYLDYRVLALLFCLMAVMEGFKQTGMFGRMAAALLQRVSSFRQLYMVLVFLCFFLAMWVTNDVALLTFVPFTILVLKLADLQREAIPVVVMQTVAANLGSMLTPVGNPQNLYLYSVSGMGFLDFLKVMGPLTTASLLLILVGCLLHKNYDLQQERLNEVLKEEPEIQNRIHKKENVVLAFLFVLSLLSVARILPWQILLVITMIVCLGMALLWKEEILLKKVDYGLLLTFVAFFIFIGNMGRVEIVREFLSQILAGREMIIGFLSSQVISNVPAAILLAGFTGDYVKLLWGVNIGGLGTLIASLASLISYKFFAGACVNEKDMGTKGAYFKWFTIVNVVFAVILLVVASVL